MTTKIKTIDKATCKLLREAVIENLAEFCDEYGVEVTTGRGSYDATNFTVKVTFHPKDVDLAKNEFEMWAKAYGVEPSDYGRELKVHGWKNKPGGMYRLVGINTKAPRFPFLGERITDGKRFKFTEKAVLAALGRSAVTG